MQKALSLLSFLTASMVTAQAAAQTVNDQSLSWLVFAVDSDGEEVLAPYQSLDPTVAPVSINLLAENDEPLSGFTPTYHTASVDADLDSTGSNWSGSGAAAAHYADALDLSVDYGGSHIPAATAFFNHVVFSPSTSQPRLMSTSTSWSR